MMTMTLELSLKTKSSDSRIVIYTRPWFTGYYTELASALEQRFGCPVETVSDYSVPGSHDLRRAALVYYDRKTMKEVGDEVAPYMLDLIKRDRLLRILTRTDAEQRILAYYCAIRDYFSKRDVACVFSATVDQYVIDLIYLYCLLRKIPFVGYHISVLPNYTLMTARGETHPFRTIDQAEISQAIEVISDRTFRPAYIPKQGRIHIAGLGRYGKNILRYAYYRIISDLQSSRLNYHVEASTTEARRRLSFDMLRALSYQFDDIPTERYLYLPLQFHPECNSEYWDRVESHEDYEDKMLRFVRTNAPKWKIVVKEHPNMLSIRGASFYKKLRQVGCAVVPPAGDHRKLLRDSFAVVTMNSSAGIEGLCEGKVVICLSRPYYASEYHLVKSSTDEVDESEILALTAQHTPEDSLHRTVARVIESSIPCALPDLYYQATTELTDRGPASARQIAAHLPAMLIAIRNAPVLAQDCFTIRKE